MDLKLRIEGMTCDHCAQTVSRALSTLPGASASVSFPGGVAQVKIEGEVATGDLLAAVADEGFSGSLVVDEGRARPGREGAPTCGWPSWSQVRPTFAAAIRLHRRRLRSVWTVKASGSSEDRDMPSAVSTSRSPTGTTLLCAGLVLTLFHGTFGAAAVQERTSLVPSISQVIELYNDLSESPLPIPRPEQFDELLQGEVVTLTDHLSLPDKGDVQYRVVAYLLLDLPRDWAWVCSLDSHLLRPGRVKQVRLREDGQGTAVSYGFLSLPWPVRDRHWVVRQEQGIGVAKATEGKIWERSWRLVDDGEDQAYELVAKGLIEGLSLKAVKKAIYLSMNTGAWTFFTLGERRTLMAYQMTTAPGGRIPERLAVKSGTRRVRRLLRTVAGNAGKMAEHYDADHRVLFGGDGQPIPPLVAG